MQMLNAMAASEVLHKLIRGAQSNAQSALRQKATSLIEEKGLPGKKNEEYKYTNLTRILEKSFAEFKGNEKPQEETLKGLIPALSAIQLVFVNGNLSESLSSYSLPKGVLLEKQDGQANVTVNSSSDEFALLNASNLEVGTSITITKGVAIETPIVVIHITDSSKNQAATHPRVNVVVEENAQATFVELFMGNGDAISFTNAATEIKCSGNSLVNYIKIGNESDNQLHVGNTQVDVAGNAVFNSITANFGGQMVRNNLRIALHESYSEANLFGLYMPNHEEHIDNHTVVDHQKPNCNSNELYKGIMNGSAKGVFNGKIYVQKDAQKTNAFQSNKNILLSDSSTINTKPQLEIWADDVKCSHGCTTGKLDKEQLFYLRSRGIGEREAKTLLINAFANEVIGQIKDEKIRTYVQDLLHTKIEG